MAERRIKIIAGSVEAEAIFNGGKTAEVIWEVLPLSAKAETWGDEIYFSIPLRLKAEDRSGTAVRVVRMGEGER